MFEFQLKPPAFAVLDSRQNSSVYQLRPPCCHLEQLGGVAMESRRLEQMYEVEHRPDHIRNCCCDVGLMYISAKASEMKEH